MGTLSLHRDVLGTTALDPVRGMLVDPETTARNLDYHGETYPFCGAHCLEKFGEYPERYQSQTGGRASTRRSIEPTQFSLTAGYHVSFVKP